jgi:protein SCO1/2
MIKRAAIIIPALLLVLGIGISYKMIKERRILPVFSPSQLNPDLVDEELRSIKSKHKIGDFNLFDQNGNTFTQSNLEDKYYVADFFFTTCPSICIDMSAQLERVQEEFKDDPSFKIVSHTVQPEIDSVSVMKEYAELHNANPEQWHFLTGNKKVIYNLARKAYFAATTEGDGGINDFIHTENFILIDKKKRIRGFYDGTSKEDVDRLIVDVTILKQEYED